MEAAKAIPANVALLIPVYKRPERIVPHHERYLANTPHEATVYYCLEDNDEACIAVCKERGYNFILNTGRSFATAINTAFTKTTEPVLFMGCDDAVYQSGWLEEALSVLAHPDHTTQVVALNDLHNQHAAIKPTLVLFTREYIDRCGTADGIQGQVLHPYKHFYCDTEFGLTAHHRGVMAYAPNAKVELCHYTFTNASIKYERDELDMYNESTHPEDTKTFHERTHLWGGAT